MKPRPEKPFLGDIHLLADYPEGTPLEQITEFEVWNGARWVHASEAGESVLTVEAKSRP